MTHYLQLSCHHDPDREKILNDGCRSVSHAGRRFPDFLNMNLPVAVSSHINGRIILVSA